MATSYRELEHQGKLYRVKLVGNGGLVRVKTKTAWRTITGHGRAFKSKTYAEIIAIARNAAS